MTDYAGGCHCGAIEYNYQTGIDPQEWSVRACQCSFCRSHDGLSTSDPGGRLTFVINDPPLLNRYRFSQKTADFLICRNCGVYIGALIETASGAWGIINLHALADPQENFAAAKAIDYGAEASTERIARRERRWTPAILAS